ncbi:hypothetical protein L3Y34_007986 [Caenorhabditis briggsae]|uniref:Uncharacterized protein n=1 Tax=Caenorhabditis briggsae TaxID=6238 RepID=A0AAE9A0V8_CAEBR|nr:hypothetical protein L3Y34_007986 [Caenorhabditis briggsae]
MRKNVSRDEKSGRRRRLHNLKCAGAQSRGGGAQSPATPPAAEQQKVHRRGGASPGPPDGWAAGLMPKKEVCPFSRCVLLYLSPQKDIEEKEGSEEHTTNEIEFVPNRADGRCECEFRKES